MKRDFIGKVVRMMKDKASSVRLKGTVLYTVVSVLMVLIVFLMGTLALAATASNRAYTNYQKEQTEYTARAVLDSVVQAINEDNTATGIKHQMVNRLQNQGNSFDVNVQIEGISHTVTITNNGTQSIYNKDTETWVTGDIYEVSTTISKTMAGTTYSAYIVGEHSITQTPSGGGGAFVSLGDTGGTEIATGGYVTGGTYIGVGIPMKDYTIGANGVTTIDSPFYVNGNLTNINAFNMHYRQSGDFFAIMGDFVISENAKVDPVYEGFTWTDTSYEKLPYIYVGGNLYINHVTEIGEYNPASPADSIATNIYCGSINGGNAADVKSVQTDFTVYGDIYTFDPTATSRVGSSGGSTALYEWTARTLQKRDGTNAVIGNWYSKGSIEFNAARGGNFVQGDVRAEKNVTITGGQTFEVTGDLVCGGTLTVSSGTLKVSGNIYANDIANSGTIQCNGVVNAYSASTPGNVQDLAGTAKAITIYDTTGLTPTSSKSVWHENLSITITQGVINSSPSYYEYSYDECANENGVETRTTITGRSGDCWWYDQNMYPTFADYLAANDTKYQELKAMEGAQGAAFATTVNFYDVAGMYGGDIYPEDFTNQKITDEILDLPVLTNYTSYPTTPVELGTSIFDPATNSYVVPTYNPSTAPMVDNHYEITTSCVLTGNFNRNIYINPGNSNPITVILKNVEMDMDAGGGKRGIIVNDASTVTMFIDGYAHIESCGIITSDYMDEIFGAGAWSLDNEMDNITASMISDLTITQNQASGSPYYPNVIIHGAVGSELVMGGSLDKSGTPWRVDNKANTVVTALVRAPEMAFAQGQGGGVGKKINYVSPNGGTMVYGSGAAVSDNQNIGVIGQLVAKHIVMPNNAKWGLIYVTQGGAVTCTCACGSCTGIPSSCSCNCGTPGCICTGGAGAALPDRFVPLYYNYY